MMMKHQWITIELNESYPNAAQDIMALVPGEAIAYEGYVMADGDCEHLRDHPAVKRFLGYSAPMARPKEPDPPGYGDTVNIGSGPAKGLSGRVTSRFLDGNSKVYKLGVTVTMRSGKQIIEIPWP